MREEGRSGGACCCYKQRTWPRSGRRSNNQGQRFRSQEREHSNKLSRDATGVSTPKTSCFQSPRRESSEGGLTCDVPQFFTTCSFFGGSRGFGNIVLRVAGGCPLCVLPPEVSLHVVLVLRCVLLAYTINERGSHLLRTFGALLFEGGARGERETRPKVQIGRQIDARPLQSSSRRKSSLCLLCR